MGLGYDDMMVAAGCRGDIPSRRRLSVGCPGDTINRRIPNRHGYHPDVPIAANHPIDIPLPWLEALMRLDEQPLRRKQSSKLAYNKCKNGLNIPAGWLCTK